MAAYVARQNAAARARAVRLAKVKTHYPTSPGAESAYVKQRSWSPPLSCSNGSKPTSLSFAAPKGTNHTGTSKKALCMLLIDSHGLLYIRAKLALAEIPISSSFY